MATSTADHIAAADPFRPFYYLKITGLPYYIFSIVNPTDSRYGAAAWTLPSGYSDVVGMQIPDDTIEQAMPDILGGIASAERLRLSMVDFDATDSNGQHSFFGRVLAPGRLSTSGSAAWGVLSSDILATADTGDTFTVDGTTNNSFVEGDVYVGGETISISDATFSSPGGGTPTIWTLTIDERNRFPCNSSYPPTPYHRITRFTDGSLDSASSIPVAQEPFSFIGRTCAFYIGHMTADGMPEPEAQAMCRVIGRITDISYGRDPGMYEFGIESIIADLADAKVAPGLAHAVIAPSIYLGPESWRKMTITAGFGAVTDAGADFADTAVKTITIDDGVDNIYATPQDLVNQVNKELAKDAFSLHLRGVTDSVQFRVILNSSGVASFHVDVPALDTSTGSLSGFSGGETLQSGWLFTVSDSAFDPQNPQGRIRGSSGGLLNALGFGNPATGLGPGIVSMAGDTADATNNDQNAHFSVAAPRPMPRVLIPLSDVDVPFEVALAQTGDANGDRFFNNPGVGEALVRFGDGNTLRVFDHSENSLTLMASQTTAGFGLRFPSYYVEPGDVATVDQIIAAPVLEGDSPDLIWGRILCSTTALVQDNEYNFFPEGVGLGLNGIIDKDSLRKLAIVLPPTKAWWIDSSQTFGQLWMGIAKECGIFLVWDVLFSRITFRLSTFPSAVNANSFTFSESNRTQTKDRTTAVVDKSQIRTGWKLQYGWDPIGKKFLHEQTIRDYWAVSAYGAAFREETIQDMTIYEPTARSALSSDYAAEILRRLVEERSQFVRYPWLKLTRTVNKTGLNLSPGTYHLIVDNTVINPFTGRMGIESTDGVYGWLMGVKHRLDKGETDVTILVDQVTDGALVRPWSPTALLDIDATQNGYVSTTGVVTLVSWFTQDDAEFDGIDFEMGDPVALVPWDTNSGSPEYEKTSTITAVSDDGHTVTIGSTLGAVSTTAETIMILRSYANSSTARKTGASKVAFQGDGIALLIAGSARLHKYG